MFASNTLWDSVQVFLKVISIEPKKFISHNSRHHNILRKIDKDKSSNQETNAIRKAIYNVNSVQTLNAICQYCPQFLLQSFLIIYRENKSVLTGKKLERKLRIY